MPFMDSVFIIYVFMIHWSMADINFSLGKTNYLEDLVSNSVGMVRITKP